MKSNQRLLNVAFLSTYPPRECGIATFTQDLVRELKKKGKLNTSVIAISDGKYTYDDEVWFDFPQQNFTSYLKTAERINHSDIDFLVVEHEYGIYGGDWGDYLLELVKRVRKPIVTTLHTVLPTPSEKQLAVLRELCCRSKKIVTMASNSCRILQEVYGVDSSKIEMIPHGVPSFDLPPREALKKERNLENRTVISTFGLISPGKGLEYGIDAVHQVAKKHPDVLYFILGQTHPVVRRQYGEAYRESLEKKVRELGLENNVQFVNKYLTKEEIVRGLQLSDLYMTPYLSRDQAVSGTLAYAAGYGRVIVSTPYLYAQEMLADGRGLLAEFKDAQSLGEAIRFLIEHPEKRKEMEEKTLRFGKTMRWDAVADRYVQTFQKAYQEACEWSEVEHERFKIAE